MSMGLAEKTKKLIAKLKETEENVYGCDLGIEIDFIREYTEAVFEYWKAATRNVSSKEKERRYEAAVLSLLLLNRLSEKLGMESFAEVDLDQEEEVKKYIGRMVMEDFQRGIREEPERD